MTLGIAVSEQIGAARARARMRGRERLWVPAGGRERQCSNSMFPAEVLAAGTRPGGLTMARVTKVPLPGTVSIHVSAANSANAARTVLR